MQVKIADCQTSNPTPMLSLAQPEALVDVNGLVPASPLSLLVVTLYFAAEIDLAPLQVPVIFKPPQLYKFVAGSSFSSNTHRNKFRAVGIANHTEFLLTTRPGKFRSFSGLLTVQVFKTEPDLKYRRGPLFEQWHWRFKQHPDSIWEPYSMKNIHISQQYVLLLMPFKTDSLRMSRKFSFVEGFLTDAKPIVFLLFYSKETKGLMSKRGDKPTETPFVETASSGPTPPGYLRSHFVGHMVNTLCNFYGGELAVSQTEVSVWWFTCPSSAADKNCWTTLVGAMNSACDKGRLAVWSLTTQMSIIWNATATPLKPAWKQLKPTEVMLQVLFPRANNADGNLSSRTRRSWQWESVYLQFDKEVTEVAQPIVFVTTEDVVSQRSGFQTYVKMFDAQTWVALLVSMLLCAVGLAWSLGASNGSSKSKRQKSSFVGNYVKALANLAFMLIDQYFVLQGNRLRGLLGAWLLSLFVLSSWYKAEVKSSFAFNFPYETKLTDWRHFENFSLFTIRGSHDQKCDESIWSYQNISELIHGVKSKAGQPLEKPELIVSHNRNDVPTELFASVLTWLQETRKEESDCDQKFARFKKKGKQECMKDYQRIIKMSSQMDYICLSEFHEFVGDRYREKVAKAREIVELPVDQWNLTEEEPPPLIGAYHTSKAHELIYWMTRRPKSAFVFSQTEFPYYWNLFKQSMKSTGNRFAHTPVNIYKDRFGNFVPQMFSLYDIEFQASPHANPPPAKWMLNRFKALATSGLTRWYQKWDLILRPLRKYPRSDEVPEGTTGAKAVSLGDDAFVNVLALWAFGLAISGVFIVLELVL